MAVALGAVGVWSPLDALPVAAAQEAVAELDELGYGALWIPETVGREPFVAASLLLSAAPRIVVATGIASIWSRDASAANAAMRTLAGAYPDRFLTGLGVSHEVIVAGLRGHDYSRPVAAMSAYLDGLDKALYRAADNPPERPQRVVAALGPKMLELGRDKADGVHPYLVTADHTKLSRDAVGPGKIVATELGVTLTTDRSVAYARARTQLAPYLTLPNYRNSWLRQGFTEDDLADGGSDRLVDALVAWGDESAIRDRVAEYLAAGADHVCVQVFGENPRAVPAAEWRALAPALTALS